MNNRNWLLVALALLGLGAAAFFLLGKDSSSETPSAQQAPEATPTVASPNPLSASPLVGAEELAASEHEDGQLLSGTVSDLLGGPVAGATVRAMPVGLGASGGDDYLLAFADDEGRYTLKLRPGHYQVWAVHSEYVARAAYLEKQEGEQSLDFALAPGAAVEGVVREFGKGTPVAGARVSFSSELVSSVPWRDSTGAGEVLADDQGHFRITGLRSGALELSARSDSASSREPLILPLGIGEEQSDLELFVHPAYSARGVVVDKASGAPVAGVRVAAAGPGRTGNSSETSAADGRFAIVGLAPGEYDLIADGESVIPAPNETRLHVESSDVEDLRIEVEQGAFIRGRVEPPMSARVGIHLDLDEGFDMSMLSATETDDKGHFRLGPFRPQELTVQAKSADGQMGSKAVTLEAGGLEGVVIAMEGAASVSGLVVDGDGKPMSNVTVALRRNQGDTERVVIVNGNELTSERGHTASDGSFRIKPLQEGEYELTVQNAQGLPLRWAGAKEDEAEDPMSLTLAKGESKSDLTLRVESLSSRLYGVVLDPDGNPAPDVWVSATAVGGLMGRPGPRPRPGSGPSEDEEGRAQQRSRSVSVFMTESRGGSDGIDTAAMGELPPVLTNDKGEFEFTGLREGSYDLAAQGPRGNARGFLRGASTDEALTLKLSNLTSLKGSVTIDGKPVTSYSLLLRSSNGRREEQVSHPEGRFQINRVSPGSYALAVRAQEGAHMQVVQVVPGENDEVHIALQDEIELRGRIVGEDGAPLPNLMVVLTDPPTGGNIEVRMEGKLITTDEEGNFASKSRPGQFLLLAMRQGEGPVAGKLITIAEGSGPMDLGEIVAPKGGFRLGPGELSGGAEDEGTASLEDRLGE